MLVNTVFGAIYHFLPNINTRIITCLHQVFFPQDWWQARRMDAAGNEVAAGLIPSRNRWEKRMRSRDRNVQWNDGMGTGKRTGSLKKMPFFKVSSNI